MAVASVTTLAQAKADVWGSGTDVYTNQEMAMTMKHLNRRFIRSG